MKLKVLLLALVITLTTGFTACASTQPAPQQEQAIAAACASIAAAEDGITQLNLAHKLTAAQYDAVAKAIAIKKPICNVSPIPTSLSSAVLQELQSSVTVFLSVKNGSK